MPLVNVDVSTVMYFTCYLTKIQNNLITNICLNLLYQVYCIYVYENIISSYRCCCRVQFVRKVRAAGATFGQTCDLAKWWVTDADSLSHQDLSLSCTGQLGAAHGIVGKSGYYVRFESRYDATDGWQCVSSPMVLGLRAWYAFISNFLTETTQL